MATANLTDNGNIRLQTKFRTLAKSAKITGTKNNTALAFSVTSDDDLTWSQPSTLGTTVQDVVNFFIPIAASDATINITGVELLDSVNRTLISETLPAQSQAAYQYYISNNPQSGVADGNSGKYTLSLARVKFST